MALDITLKTSRPDVMTAAMSMTGLAMRANLHTAASLLLGQEHAPCPSVWPGLQAGRVAAAVIDESGVPDAALPPAVLSLLARLSGVT